MSSTNATSSQKQELTLAESQAEVSSQTQQPSFLHLEAPRHAHGPAPGPSCGQFLGRGWLFREVHQHLSSHLPTNRCSVAQ